MATIIDMSERRAVVRATTTGLLDPVAAWRALPAEARDSIGAAAVAHGLAAIGTYHGLEPNVRWQIADAEGWALLESLLQRHLPAAFGADWMPVLPDLLPLGISACVVCGGTDEHICTPRA